MTTIAALAALSFTSSAQAAKTLNWESHGIQFEILEHACEARDDIRQARMELIGAMDTNAATSTSYQIYSLLNPASEFVGIAFLAGSTTEEDRFSACQIEKGQISFKEGGGRVFARLDAEGLDTAHGGTIALSYLYNGIRSTYRVFSFKVVNQGGKWELSTNSMKDDGSWTMFNHFFLHKRTTLGKIIGISWVEPSVKNIQPRL